MNKKTLEDDLLPESGELILTVDGFENDDGKPTIDIHPHHIEFKEDYLYVDQRTEEYFIPYDAVLLAHRHVD